METVSSSSSLPASHEPSNYDELSMKMSLLFSDSLKDLKHLRRQLYSAAEYFEASYMNDDQKQIVIDTLKEYTVKALVNTVDHLGSVTYKVNGLLDEKVDEVSATELRVSCIEQRLRTCQEYIDHEGNSQQSLMITTPKYHKHYILPVGKTMCASRCTVPKYQVYGLDNEDNQHQLRKAAPVTTRDTPPSSARRPSVSPTPRSSQLPGTFSFKDKQKVSDKRTVSPHCSMFPLRRSESLSSSWANPNSNSSRLTTPKLSRPTTLNSSSARRRHPSEPQKSASMRFDAERVNTKDIEQQPSKGKSLLKSLLSWRNSKKDDVLCTFLDEY